MTLVCDIVFLQTNAKEIETMKKLEMSANKSDWDNPEMGYKVTVRASGKCHPAFIRPDRPYTWIVCHCPGSQNGRLEKQCSVVSKGWKDVNCSERKWD
jgi:hypothetical protein